MQKQQGIGLPDGRDCLAKWSWRGGIFGDDGGIQQEFIKMTGRTAGQLGVNYPLTLGKRVFILPILIANLRQASLDERGFAGGADFWLKTGESVTVGDRQNVFGLTRDWGNTIDTNLNGKKTRMNVGDTVATDSCTVFFKQAIRRADGRIGFDVSCV